MGGTNNCSHIITCIDNATSKPAEIFPLIVLKRHAYALSVIRFMKLSLMGTTIVASTADLGSAPANVCDPEHIDFYHAVSQYPAK